MSYQAKILADSISPGGVRLTTLWVTFPRFILAEVNTHRMLSRNSNSSRAIPPERQIEAVRTKPFVPETFNKRVKGMGVGEALPDQEKARRQWIFAARYACRAAENLLALDVDKSRVNRLLEPFLWHSAVITATEWSNFFALRDSPQAQPEFQITARLMREVMEASEPRLLTYGDWHLPGVDDDELGDALVEADDANDKRAVAQTWEYWKRVSAGRLARWTSYDKTEYEEPDSARDRCTNLISSFHLSPLEHQARPFSRDEDEWVGSGMLNPFAGNFRGWVQFRKEIPNESNASLAL
jgi:hypothetical protein